MTRDEWKAYYAERYRERTERDREACYAEAEIQAQFEQLCHRSSNPDDWGHPVDRADEDTSSNA